jgi:hypothetical protein
MCPSGIVFGLSQSTSPGFCCCMLVLAPYVFVVFVGGSVPGTTLLRVARCCWCCSLTVLVVSVAVERFSIAVVVNGCQVSVRAVGCSVNGLFCLTVVAGLESCCRCVAQSCRCGCAVFGFVVFGFSWFCSLTVSWLGILRSVAVFQSVGQSVEWSSRLVVTMCTGFRSPGLCFAGSKLWFLVVI